jgi:hypothetical protein
LVALKKVVISVKICIAKRIGREGRNLKTNERRSEL